MYTLQALWTQARERLDVLDGDLANRSYAILRGEFANVGARNPGRKALDMLSLGNPALDWVSLARAWASRASACDDRRLRRRLPRRADDRGPFLIEVIDGSAALLPPG